MNTDETVKQRSEKTARHITAKLCMISQKPSRLLVSRAAPGGGAVRVCAHCSQLLLNRMRNSPGPDCYA